MLSLAPKSLYTLSFNGTHTHKERERERESERFEKLQFLMIEFLGTIFYSLAFIVKIRFFELFFITTPLIKSPEKVFLAWKI